MARLKPSFVKDIYNALNNSCFTTADFNIEFPESTNTYVTIFFKHKPEYKLRLIEKEEKEEIKYKDHLATAFTPTRTEYKKYTNEISVEIPGEFKTEEYYYLNSFEEVIERIPKWCINIKKDIGTCLNIEDNFNDLRTQLEEMLKEYAKDESEQFSTDEIEKLHTKFDSLYQQFVKLEEQNKITKESLYVIKKELNQIKANAKNFPKGIWARVTNNKLINVMVNFSKSKEGKSLIVEGIRKLLN